MHAIVRQFKYIFECILVFLKVFNCCINSNYILNCINNNYNLNIGIISRKANEIFYFIISFCVVKEGFETI